MSPAGRPKSEHKTAQVAFRFPEDLLARVDRHLERLKAAAPWSTPTRADAVRDLVARALDALEQEETKAPRKR